MSPHDAAPAPDAEAGPRIDSRRIWAARDRAADAFDGTGVLGREIGRRMLERLDVVRVPDGPIVDVGCATGTTTQLLRTRYPGRLVVGIDPSVGLLSATAPTRGAFARMRALLVPVRNPRIGADPGLLPLRTGTAALIWSNLLLHSVGDAERALRSWLAALRPGGLLMFSTFGPDTLGELRRAFAIVDSRSHVHDFVDLHNVGDSLVGAGFADPVMDMELVTLTYRDIAALVADLRGQGWTNAATGRPRGLYPPRHWRAMTRVYDELRIDDRLPATFEVIQGHAWKPLVGPRRTADGLDVIHVHRRGPAA